MDEELFYIEPSALYYSKTLTGEADKESINVFLDEFEELLRNMTQKGYHFVIDLVLGKRIIDETGENLIPVSLSDIDDNELRKRIHYLRQTFYSIINPMAVYIELKGCSCLSNSFEVISEKDRELLQDSNYFDFFHSLAEECHNQKQIYKILILKSYTKFRESSISIKCICSELTFQRTFELVTSGSLIKESEKKKAELKNAVNKIKKYKKEEIKVVQAVHHPWVGNTIIEHYKDIPYQFRKVLDVLLFFGMFKLEFRDFASHGGRKGDIHNCTLNNDKSSDSHEILEGWLISQKGSCKLVMYFQYNLGSLLTAVLGNNFLYNEIMNLKDEIF